MAYHATSHNGFVRKAGLLTILGSVLGIAINIGELTALSDTTSTAFLLAQIVLAFAFGMMIVGLIGMARSGAIGNSHIGEIGLKAALIGQTLAIPSQFIQHIEYDIATALGILAGVILGVGMLLVGISVIQAQVWSVWRRYTPLLYGLCPLFMIPTYPLLIQLPMFDSGSDQSFTVITLAFWLLFGIALFNETDSAKITSRPALNG